VIAIETAGPEHLTFVYQIDTMELPTSYRGSAQWDRGKEMSHIGYIGYLSPALIGSRIMATINNVGGGVSIHNAVFSILHDAALPRAR